MDTIPVTLIVKAPNHTEYEDQTVQCEMSWTISKLKGHLSEVYPCKPEEQKLIYSGQLLQDAVVLKDVLRQFDGQETHTVHLVYTPKQQKLQQQQSNKDSSSSPSAMTGRNEDAPASGDMHSGRDGLRRRNVPSPTTTNAGDQGSSTATTTYLSSSTSPQGTSGVQLPINLQASAFYSQPFATSSTATSEQISAYQQWYHAQINNYMSQYMVYMANLQQQPCQMPLWPGMNVPYCIPPQIQQVNVRPVNSNDVTADVGAVPGEAAAPQPQQQQQPRFPIMVHEPERPDRDWLDYVNTICRTSFLLVMIYFYSSALRFTMVMLALLAIFLYRNRRTIFRRRDQLPNQAVVVAPPPPGIIPVAVAPIPENIPPEAAAGERPINADNNNNVDVANRNAEATNGPEQNNPTTVLSFLRTFVSSFFASLLPEPAIG